jgi:hypothetical protein
VSHTPQDHRLLTGTHPERIWNGTFKLKNCMYYVDSDNGKVTRVTVRRGLVGILRDLDAPNTLLADLFNGETYDVTGAAWVYPYNVAMVNVQEI